MTQLPTDRTTSSTVEEHLADHNTLCAQHNDLDGHAADTTSVHGIADTSTLATQSYVSSAIAGLVASAPATLDTLNELAAALGDDANFASTVTTALGGKASTSHHTAHEPGGGDAMAVDAAAATGSLRTIGTGSTQAAAGNHAHSAYVATADFDAKGDLLVASANDAYDNLAAGTDGYVLTADSTQTLGVKWAAAGGGSGAMTQIASQVLSGSAASVTFSSIPGTYNALKVLIMARTDRSATSDPIRMWFNGDTTGTNYPWQSIRWNNATISAQGGGTASNQIALTLPCASNDANEAGIAVVDIPGYATTTFHKTANTVGGFADGTNANATSAYTVVRWKNTAAITSIQFISPFGSNFLTGSTFYLYGVT